jgi:ribonuclease D
VSQGRASVPEPQWVDDQAAFEEVCAELVTVEAFAFDTEFHRERTYYPRVALVQLAWDDKVVLVDPLAVDLAPFATVLAGDAIVVAHAAEQDIEVLQRSCAAVPRTLFDTQVAAGFLGFSSASLGALCSHLVGEKLPKADRLTDWTRRPLAATQIRYAAADVVHLLEIRRRIIERLEPAGRLPWAIEESARLLARSIPDPDPATAWWRMKEARSLRGATRGVAQAVAEWRERTAMRVDRPARFVLADMAMAGIVHRAPTSREDLRDIRGLDPRTLRPETADGLLAAVERGKRLPDHELRLPPVADLERELRPAVALVASWIAQLARDVKIDATLLATRADISALLRKDPDARLASGWRAELLAEPIRRLVEGEAALAFGGNGQLVLEARSHQPVEVDLPPVNGAAE